MKTFSHISLIYRRRMIKWFGFFFLAAFVFSCGHVEKGPVYYPDPATLEELFSGFSKAELTPDIIDSNEEPVVIVATGHLYPLLYHPEVYEALIRQAVEEKPDYFFNLGDVVYNNTDAEWETVFNKFNNVDARFYFSPGNHDINYHYERYNGKRDNQIEAELRYLTQVGYRYKVLQDQFANYVFINANDSAHRIRTYLNLVKEQLDREKHMILISSQSLWHDKYQDPNDPRSWVKRPFHRDTLLRHVEYFDYLIHGDWGGKFFRSKWKKSNGAFEVMGVGNRKAGDTLYITRLEIYKDSIISKPVLIDIPDNSDWYN